MQLKAYSQLLDETVELGLPTTDLDKILELGDFMASGRDSLIVFVEGHLPKWEDS